MDLVRNNTFDNDIVFVDGHGGTGKVLISVVISSFKDVEKHIEDEMVYIISRLYRLNKITEDAAIVFLRIVLDRRLIYLMLSRQINIKRKEVMSVFKNPFFIKYLKRLFIYDKKEVYKEIEDKKPILQNMTQNAIYDIDLHLKAFGDRLKLIYINRHPVDVIYDMYNRRFLDNIGEDSGNIRLTYDWKGEDIPIFMKKWKPHLFEMNDMDKVINWIYDLTISDTMTFNKLSKKEKEHIMFIDFDEFVTKPIPICKDIEKFIGKDMTFKTKGILKREKCPRRLKQKERDIKKKFIRECCGDVSMKLLDKLIDIYEKKKSI